MRWIKPIGHFSIQLIHLDMNDLFRRKLIASPRLSSCRKKIWRHGGIRKNIWRNKDVFILIPMLKRKVSMDVNRILFKIFFLFLFYLFLKSWLNTQHSEN